MHLFPHYQLSKTETLLRPVYQNIPNHFRTLAIEGCDVLMCVMKSA